MRCILLTSYLLVAAAWPAVAQVEQAQTETAQEIPATEAPEPAIEEVVVSGEQPGPELWKVSKGDHVLWILGTLTPLPEKMTWRSRHVEQVIASSQEVITTTSIEADIGFFKGLTLLPSVVGARKSPEGATLQEVLPADLYARWLTLKTRYIGRDSGIEKWRPIFAAQELYSKALKKSNLTYSSVVWPVVKKIAKQNDVKITTPQILVEIDKPRAAIKEFKKSSLDDVECFSKTLERLETDLEAMRSRANAWAVGDLDALRKLPPPDQRAACWNAIMNSQVVQQRGYQDMPERVARAWMQSAEAALANNRSTFAMLSIGEMLRPDGYIARFQAKGYVVDAP
jgi:hypothetical protein